MKDFGDTFQAIEEVLSLKVARRQKDLEYWQKVKEDAAHEEDAVLRDIGEMELALNVLRRVVGKPAMQEAFPGVDILRFRTQTVAESASEVMEQRGGRAKVGEIIDVLMQAGKLKPNRRIAYSTVLKILDRNKRFVKLGPGTFGLASKGYIQEER